MAGKSILCDMDSIVTDLLGDWLKAYNASYGDSLAVEGVVDWDMHKIVKPECGLKLYDILDQPGFFERLRPLPGAVDGIEMLKSNGHDITFVTAGKGSHTEQKYAWVKKHFGHIGLGSKDIIIANAAKKKLVRGDVLIDDCPSTCLEYKQAWPGARVLTIAYPYNESVADVVDLRAESHADTESAWEEIVRFI